MRSTVLGFALLMIATAPVLADKAPPRQMMVYVVAYDHRCDGSPAYRTQMADSSNYSKLRNELQKTMKQEYPNAQGWQAGSSNDWGKDAGAVAIIEIDTSEPKCKKRAIAVKFGTDVASAADNAKKQAEGKPYKTILQEYFVKVTTAP